MIQEIIAVWENYLFKKHYMEISTDTRIIKAK